jgi:hypothetical protein
VYFAATIDRAQQVLGVDFGRTGRDERQATVVRVADLDVELETASSEGAADPSPRTRREAFAVELEQLEPDRRPAGDRVRLGQLLENLLGAGSSCSMYRRPATSGSLG